MAETALATLSEYYTVELTISSRLGVIKIFLNPAYMQHDISREIISTVFHLKNKFFRFLPLQYFVALLQQFLIGYIDKARNF